MLMFYKRYSFYSIFSTDNEIALTHLTLSTCVWTPLIKSRDPLSTGMTSLNTFFKSASITVRLGVQLSVNVS